MTRIPAAIDPAVALANHVATACAAALPAATRIATCRDILDTLGCMLGGTGAPGIDTLVALARRWGGREEAAVLCAGIRVPAHHAALANAAMGHALDFDDTHDLAGSIHPGAPVLAAALAATALRGAVSGDEFILAVALGLDVACRVALGAPEDRGWHRTAAMGVFGATASASRLLGLTSEQVVHAFGIALSQAAGTRQCIDDGALTKRFQAGQASSAGVLSALLAVEGFTGAREVFTGRYGFLPMYQPGRFDGAALVADLGEIWEGDRLSLKPWPCFRPAHAAIDAALGLREALALGSGEPAQITGVTLATDPRCYTDQFEGGAHKRRPRHVIEAQFATPFLVATALLRGHVRIADVARPDDERILGLADRIEGLRIVDRQRGWARLTVTTADGRSATREVARAAGSPEHPLTDAALDAKFRDCAANAVRPIDHSTVDVIIDCVRNLRRQHDAAALIHLLSDM
jgi:2-methylcitrate dehydratase PrpD